MKSYTDLEQSKKLAEILPIESADMHYVRRICDFRGNPVDDKWSVPKYGNPNSEHANYIVQNFASYEKLSCWSLSALLEMLSFPDLFKNDGWNLYTTKPISINNADNPIDACYEMIIKLHELKML